MHQPYPSAGQQQRLPEQAPRSVRTAVKLMYGGVAANILGIIINLTTISSIRRAILTSYPLYSTGQVHRLELVTVGGSAVIGLLAVGLWIWMAQANSAGKSWARVFATVLFGINTLAMLATIARPHSTYELLTGILVWLIGLVAVTLLWQKSTSAYLQAR
jgi:hypothetical protein